MLKIIASIHQQLRNKELPRLRKLSSLKQSTNGFTTAKPNTNKFYSVFVSNDDAD
jgi:hypothetical protein